MRNYFALRLILIKFKILKEKKPPLVNFFWQQCKIPWFFPDFLIFIKFPDFSIQGIFFHHFPCFPCFPESVATLCHGVVQLKRR